MVEMVEETAARRPGIRAVNEAAFGRSDEADLVDRLRADGEVLLSLVALDEDGQVVGHILFSELPILVESRTIHAAALAPMAVHPDRQRQGIGSGLLQRGLELCRERGMEAVLVLGHPDYYTRFGFSAEAARHLDAPHAGNEAFMALELRPGALAGRGKVEYAPAFQLEGADAS